MKKPRKNPPVRVTPVFQARKSGPALAHDGWSSRARADDARHREKLKLRKADFSR